MKDSEKQSDNIIGFIPIGEKGDLIPIENIEGREELKGNYTPDEFMDMYAKKEVDFYQTSTGVKFLKSMKEPICSICNLPGETKCTQQANCLNISMESELKAKERQKKAEQFKGIVGTNTPFLHNKSN